MKYLKAHNWEKFQHFKDRRPPWIKLYRDILDDYNYHCLPIESKAIAPLLWLMASESGKDGMIEGDIKVISFRLRMSVKDALKAINPLIEKGFFESDIGMISTRYQNVIPETYSKEAETYSKEAETKSISDDFENFWNFYGKIGNKKKALETFQRIKNRNLEEILAGVKAYQAKCFALKTEQKYIKHAVTWLNQEGWKDDYTIHTNHTTKQYAGDSVTAGFKRAILEHAEQPID